MILNCGKYTYVYTLQIMKKGQNNVLYDFKIK